MSRPFTDEELRKFLSMYDDEYSFNRISQITKRDVKDIHSIYDEMFYIQLQYIKIYNSTYGIPLICKETGKHYNNASEAAKDNGKSRYMITRSAMFGFAVGKKHFVFDEAENG